MDELDDDTLEDDPGRAAAEATIAAAIAGAEDLDEARLADCPVTPLGHRQRSYFFFSPVGELLEMPARVLMSQDGLVSLFCADTGWLMKHFPHTDANGKIKGFSHSHAGRVLMALCVREGLFNAAMPLRYWGVWREGATLLVHCGDVIMERGPALDADSVAPKPSWLRAGIKRGSVLYGAAPRLERPAAEPATADDGRFLLETLRQWRFDGDTVNERGDITAHGIGADLACGWTGQTYLAGALHWRAHLQVLAQPGSGKSWLATAQEAALGGAGHPQLNDVTPASLYQALSGTGLGLVLDEAENDAAGKVKAVIELIRRMSSDGGARIGRGTSEGKARAYTLTGTAYLSSVVSPPLTPQDRSRITQLRLLRLPTGAGNEARFAQVQESIEALRRLSPKLRARALAGWERFNATFEAYRSGYIGHGLDPRFAEQVATLLAGRDLLIEDTVPTRDMVEGEIDRCRALVAVAEEQREENSGRKCLSHLYTSPIDLWRGGERETVAEAIMKGMEDVGSNYRAAIQRFGLRLYRPKGGGPWTLFVANSNVGLDRIFQGTDWQGGGWGGQNGVLRYLGEDVRPSARPIWFKGDQQRATAIPEAYLPREVPPGDEDAPPDDWPVDVPG